MLRAVNWSRRFWRPAASALAAAALILVAAGGASGQTSPVVKVEEDWELIIGEPDGNSVAPQVTCAMSPAGGLAGLHATFELNSQSLESYSAGGLQLQIWNGETAVAAKRYPEHQVLSLTGETITWTSSMTLEGGWLTFEITSGNSQTWGHFGGTGALKHSLETGLTSLAEYSPAVSAEHSGVGYASNRVFSLKLLRVRVTTADDQVVEQTSPVSVWPVSQ